jgi:hypothetical protein
VSSDRRTIPTRTIPLYYAPQRSVRSEANPRSSSAQHRSEDRFPPTATYRSRFDEMREEAFAKTIRDSLESEFVHEGRQPRLLLAVAGGMAAGIGVSVIAALVFFGLALQLQFSPEMSIARVGLMGPAPGRPCEDMGVRDPPLGKLHGDAADFLDRPADQE